KGREPAMGYLTVDGEYRDRDPNMLDEFFDRVAVDDADPNFAETLCETGARPVWIGLEGAELWQMFLQGLRNAPSGLLQGALSYPVDIGWFGYGCAASLGLVGSEAQGRIVDTARTAGRLLGEVAVPQLADRYQRQQSIIELNQGEALPFPNVPTGEGPAPQALDRLEQLDRFGGENAGDAAGAFLAEALRAPPTTEMRVALLASTYINSQLTQYGYHTAGRFAGGAAVKLVLSMFAARAFPVGGVAAINSWYYTAAMFLITTLGSIIRLAEKHYDKFGNLDNMTVSQLLLSFTSGVDDIDEMENMRRQTMREVDQNWDHLCWNHRRYLREVLGVSFGEESPSLDRQAEALGARLNEIRWELISANTEDEFYEALLKAHNEAIFMKQLGINHPMVDYFVRLGDPTVLHFLNMVLVSISRGFVNLTGPMDLNFWNIIMREQRRYMEQNNNPDYRFD
ncbi:MAG: hypothetical protein AAFY59_08970, partial [Pseudomonadota bacterium]